MSKIGIQIRGTSPILRQGLAQGGRAQPSNQNQEAEEEILSTIEKKILQN